MTRDHNHHHQAFLAVEFIELRPNGNDNIQGYIGVLVLQNTYTFATSSRVSLTFWNMALPSRLDVAVGAAYSDPSTDQSWFISTVAARRTVKCKLYVIALSLFA